MAAYGLTQMWWNGLQFGRGTPRLFDPDNGLQGWLSLPPFQKDRQPRYGLHGDALSAVRYQGRTVTASGFVQAADDRDGLVQEFRRIMVPDRDPRALSELIVTQAGETLSAFGQLVQADITPSKLWGQGWFRWKAQFECPDPRRFGGERTMTTPIAAPGGGITPPLTPPITLPTNPLSGVITVNNTGSAPAPVRFLILGPLTGTPGVALLGAGKFLRFVQNLEAGQALAGDTDGYCTLDGQSVSPTGGSSLMIELEAPPGVSTYQAVGDPGSGSPSFMLAFRPASW